MPKHLLKLIPILIGVGSFGLGIMGGVWAGGIRVGQIETRVHTLESCSEYTVLTLDQLDERVRATEAAAATLPAIAEDLREIRSQMQDLITLLASGRQAR